MRELAVNALFQELITKCFAQALQARTEQTCHKLSGKHRLQFTWAMLLMLQQKKKKGQDASQALAKTLVQVFVSN